MRKGYMHNGWYDPDPDPSPVNFGFLVALAGAILGGFAIYKPFYLEGLIKIINPQFLELDEDEQKKQTDFYKTIFMVLTIVCVIYLLVQVYEWQQRKKARRMTRLE
jgi:hypothetical protein